MMIQENDILNGTYQVLRPIGRGGAGVIYLAYHLRLQKYVVLKRITQHFSGNLSFRKEVDILKNLHHPHLPQVYDFVQEYDSVYTVIDFVDGCDLEEYIAAGYPFTERQLFLWFYQLTDVLAYLHRQTPPIIHSDIKPGNIIINSAGDAILIDFNISLDAEQEAVKGYSLPYASAEQIHIARCIAQGLPQDGALDGRTDLYSLGACFYRLISGTPPAIDSPSPPLAHMGLDYNEGFLRVIDRAMQYRPEQRYPSAKKMLSALDRTKRQTQQYRKFVACQCAALLAGAMLVGGGLYCLITGTQQEKKETYLAAVTQIYSSYAEGDGTQAQADGLLLLNDSKMQPLLEKNPEDHGKVLRILGDVAYEQGNYTAAAGYYDQALSYAQSQAEQFSCLRSGIIACAEAGYLTQAQEKLRQAEAAGLDSNSMLLIEIVLASQSGQQQECFDRAAELLQQCGNQELCSRACLAAACAATDADTEILWLEKGLGYGRMRTILRGLTVAYAELAQQTGSADAAGKALAYGRELTEAAYATKNDWLNYAAALCLVGNYTEAVRTLEELLKTYPHDYLVLMDLAFAYDALGNEARTKEYCALAVSAWMGDVSADKLSQEDERIQNLLALQKKYG